MHGAAVDLIITFFINVKSDWPRLRLKTAECIKCDLLFTHVEMQPLTSDVEKNMERPKNLRAIYQIFSNPLHYVAKGSFRYSSH